MLRIWRHKDIPTNRHADILIDRNTDRNTDKDIQTGFVLLYSRPVSFICSTTTTWHVSINSSVLSTTRQLLHNTHTDVINSLTQQRCQICHPNRVRLISNGTNLGLLKISFSTIWLEPKCTETDLKKSQIWLIEDQSEYDIIWGQPCHHRLLLCWGRCETKYEVITR